MISPKRQVVLDTETTGLSTADDHRIIEIGCVELVNRKLTGATFHQYINPERAIDTGATAVHGITSKSLQDKPKFAEISDEFMQFIDGAELIIHNAVFDVGFIDHELAKIKSEKRRINNVSTILDTLKLARDKHPGQKNNLDALCRLYEVDNSSRELHGALLDSKILAGVYLAMTGGQTNLLLAAEEVKPASKDLAKTKATKSRGSLRVIKATADELLAHKATLQRLDKASGSQCVWLAKSSTPSNDHTD